MYTRAYQNWHVMTTISHACLFIIWHAFLLFIIIMFILTISINMNYLHVYLNIKKITNVN